MSDHETGPDPLDKAYVQAESMLNDEDVRAARRARILAAVEREPVSATPVATKRSARRYGGWLAAASVAGLSVWAGSQLYRQPQSPPSATPPPAAAPAPVPDAASPPAARAAQQDAQKASAAPPAAVTQTPRPAAAAPLTPAPPPMRTAPADAPTPPVLFPAPAPPPPPAMIAPSIERAAPRMKQAFPASPADIARTPSATDKEPAPDSAARLRAAAAAGRVEAVEALLASGAPVDAADAEGQTALMKSVQSDRPAAAAALRRHGASLEQKDRAGRSARDMAAAKGDAALNQALGLIP